MKKENINWTCLINDEIKNQEKVSGINISDIIKQTEEIKILAEIIEEINQVDNYVMITTT